MKCGKHMKQTSSVKSTKRALVASAACTLLCGFLLFSTSVAWFTATKESTLNEIYSGNLDVELKYSKDMTIWDDVEGESNIFNNVNDQPMIWEPGAVNVVYFKVENKGSLAAKYDFTVEIDSEVKGTNCDEQEFKLSDYIKGGVTEVSEAFAGETENDKRTAATSAVESEAKTLQEIHTGAPLITDKMNGIPVVGTSEKQEKTFALVLYMPNDAETGEKTNYKTPSDPALRPKISLKLKFVATQMTGEADSFGNQYDKGAYEIKVPVGATPQET